MSTDARRDAFRARLRDALTRPRDVAALAVFRLAFGAIVAISAIRFAAYGWIDQCFVMPRVHFSYWGFGWLPLPSPVVTYVLFALLGALGLMVAIGLFFRPAVAGRAGKLPSPGRLGPGEETCSPWLYYCLLASSKIR